MKSKNKNQIKIMTGSRKNPELVLEEITAEEAEEKHRLGAGYGMDINMCIYMGARHCPDFIDRVKWYSAVPEDDETLVKYRQNNGFGVGFEFYSDERVK